MDRARFDNLVQALYHEGDMGEAKARALLARFGVSPDQWPMTDVFTETAAMYGATVGTRTVEEIAREYGWSDPDEVDHVAVHATPTRHFVVIQSHPDNTPDVEVYIYRVENDTEGTVCWTIDAPIVRSTS